MASLDEIRALAGIQVLSEGKKKKKDDEVAPPDADASADADAAPAPKGKGEKSDEEKLQEMLEKMAKKAEGKDAEALVPVFRKVYDAGVKDGIAQAKEDTVTEEIVVEDDGELARFLKAIDSIKTNIDKARIKAVFKAAHKAGKLG